MSFRNLFKKGFPCFADLFQNDFLARFFQTQEKSCLGDNIFGVNTEASCAKN